MIKTLSKRFRMRLIVPGYPALNIYSHVASRTTALGPVCVATAVKEMEGWDAEVIDENNLKKYYPQDDSGGLDHLALQKKRTADVIGLYGGLTSTIPRLYKLARLYKEAGVTVIAGGQHFVSETIEEGLNSGIDYIVLGEGEEAVKELLRALENKDSVSGIRGLAYLENGKVHYTQEREQMTDFEKLPLPDFSLVRYADIKLYPIERIRGCGMNCEFCTVKGRPRHSSSERFLERVSLLVETRNAKEFFVVDDLFGQQRDETVRLCRMLAEYQLEIGKKLSFFVQIRLDKAMDTELLTAMRAAGVDGIAIGFESPIEEELKAMDKKLKQEDMVSYGREYRKRGFLVHGMFIFGYPYAGASSFRMGIQERIKRYRDFIKKAKIDTVQVLLPVPLPGTELRQRLIDEGRLFPLSDLNWEYYDGNFPLFAPDEPLSAEEMQSAARMIMGKFYQFKYLFLIALNVASFPAIVFFLNNIASGWRRWYRRWRNNLMRFGGWIVLKRWKSQFRKDGFSEKLKHAQSHLGRLKKHGQLVYH